MDRYKIIMKCALIPNAMDWFGEEFKKSFVEFCTWLVVGLFNVLTPFVEWGCKLVIVWCVVTLFCSGDKKLLTTASKCFLIYLLFFMIRSVIL
jgi:hypothetical protein